MKAYRSGMQKFQESGAKVFAISTDNTPSQKAFAESLELPFPLLSDFLDRSTSKAYGVYVPQAAVSNRVTFVIGPDRKINFIEFGGDAMKILGAGDACSRLAHKKAG
jgi:peroxiredoxin